MDPSQVIYALQKNRDVFKHLLTDMEQELYMWKAEKTKWCLLEIVCHLYDEEREDFRARLKHTLETPGKSFSPIDPVGWVKKRKYLEQNYSDMVYKFLLERSASLKWLSSLQQQNWEISTDHPTLGRMSAGLLLYNWLAHDYLHIKQVTQTKYLYLQNSGKDLKYAGVWK